MGDTSLKTVYTNIDEISGEQEKIMKFISGWVHDKKTPVPLKEIIKQMNKLEDKNDTIIYSLKILVKKGFIRRAQGIDRENSSTAFVQLRTVYD